MASDVLVGVVILAVAGYLGYGRRVAKRANAEKRQVLGGLIGKDVILGVSNAKFVFDEAGTVTQVGQREVALSGRDGKKVVPYTAIRDINRGAHRLGHW
jgi:hypothetical protein